MPIFRFTTAGAVLFCLMPIMVQGSIWGVKTKDPFSGPPSTLFRFEEDGSILEAVGEITIEGVGVDVDGLALDPGGALFGFVPGDSTSQLISIDSATAEATVVSDVTGSFRGAAFTPSGELIAVDVLASALVEFDVQTGAPIGSPKPLTHEGQLYPVASGTDIAFDGAGGAVISSASVEVFRVDVTTGVMTLLFSDFVVGLDGIQVHGAGLAYASNSLVNHIFLYDVNGDDDVFRYDLDQAFLRSPLFLEIIPGYNAGRGDLASFPAESVSGVEQGSVPVGLIRVLDNHPNPFNPRTSIVFELEVETRVDLQIFDVAGRRVRGLREGMEARSGRQVVVWDGLDDRGQRVPAGVYFTRLTAGDHQVIRSMVLVK